MAKRDMLALMYLTRTMIAVAAVACFAGPLGAQGTYKKGSTVKAFSAKDQFDRAYTFRKGTAYLLVSFDMESGKAANQALAAAPKNYLQSKKAVFVANIHGMPKVGRMFALPKMKKYQHTIVLGDSPDLLTPYPRQEGKVTVLKLDQAAKVQKISYWSPGTEKLADQLR